MNTAAIATTATNAKVVNSISKRARLKWLPRSRRLTKKYTTGTLTDQFATTANPINGAVVAAANAANWR